MGTINQFETEKGLQVLEVDSEWLQDGGCGFIENGKFMTLCDCCNVEVVGGKLIPLVSRLCCDKCFNEFFATYKPTKRELKDQKTRTQHYLNLNVYED